MPNKLFSSSYLKIERANKHIEEFEAAWDALINDNPDPIFLEKDSNTSEVAIKIKQPPLPEYFSAIVGDAVHNLHTALDHLACQLVRHNGGTDVTKTVFPLGATTRKDFVSRVERKAEGASKDALDLLKTMNVYNGGDGEELSNLHTLDVLDKHISLILGAHFVSVSNLKVSNDRGSLEFEYSSVREGVITLGTILGEGPVTIEDYGQASVDIIFRETEGFEGESVLSTLKQFSQLVLGIVDTFEAEFG